MTIETLKSPIPRNRNSISVVKSKFSSVSSMNTLLAILKVTDARLDVILAGGLYHRFPWGHHNPPPPLHGTFNFVNIMHFLQGFSEIFLQEWSKYVCQTAFGEVLCKYWTEAMSYEYPLMWLWIRGRPPYRAGDYFPHSGFFSVAQNLVYVCVRVMRRRLGFIVLIRED